MESHAMTFHQFQKFPCLLLTRTSVLIIMLKSLFRTYYLSKEVTAMGATQAKKLTQDSDYDLEEEEEYYVTRPRTSARRYDRPPQRDTLDDANVLKGAFVQPRRSIVSPKTVSPKTNS